MSEAKSSKKIDWNDPSVIRYHAPKMKPKIIAQVWDFNQHIEPMDLEHGSEMMKSLEKIKEEDVDAQKEMKEVSKESRAKRKKSLPRKSTRSTVKRQKIELDDEKEDLKGYLDIVPREDVAEDVESLSTRQDIMELYRLVKERYSSSKPEGYDLMLWGDLHTLFEPDEESEIWMNQNEYNLISWNLCDFCGVHILLMQNGIAIHMLTEKKYPLSQEMLSKMLSKRLEVDHESTQAYELLKFIRSQGRIVGNKSSSRVNTAKEDASKQERKIANIDADVEVTLVDETQGRNDEEMFDTSILDGEEGFVEQDVVEKEVSTAEAVTTAAIITTTAVTRPKARGVVVQEPSEFTTITSPSQPSQLPQAKDKGKEKMTKRKNANIAEWDNVQAMMYVDYELAARLQAEEQGELTIEEKSRLFVELMNKRKKYFARLGAEE
ncbi:hypothetical protein Tco_1102916 [Tanacetum coccineum]